jgi:hypothetical protein
MIGMHIALTADALLVIARVLRAYSMDLDLTDDRIETLS